MVYTPREYPEDKERFNTYIIEELRAIANEIKGLNVEGINFFILQNDVDKPRAGLLAMSAAGNLGVSEGLYRYSSGGSWVYIG